MLPAEAARVDDIVRSVMREEHIAGCSVGIARRGNVIYLKGYGVRDVSSHRPADGYTIYRAGSITKQFTAAAVLQLADQRAIALSAPIGEYLPALQRPAASVSVAELLAQQSGIPSYTDPGASFASVLALPLDFQPGTNWAYSNTNYFLLGKLLETQRHLSYPDILEDAIVKPLGLHSTGYNISPFATNVAIPYTYDGRHFVPVENLAQQLNRVGAAGAIATNAVDLLSWLEALRGGRVVSPQAFDAMTHQAKLPNGAPTHYGFGFFTRDWYGWHVAEHPGNIDGFSADDAIVLDDGLEIAVLSNADRVSLAPLSESIVAIFDAPKDANMYATAGQPAENENLDVTATVRELFGEMQRGTIDRTLLSDALSASYSDARLKTRAAELAPLGKLRLVEFIERTNGSGRTYEKYRLTFEARQFWMTLGYLKNGKIDALTLVPDDD